MSTPLGGEHIIFAFSGVCRPLSGIRTLGFPSFKGNFPLPTYGGHFKFLYFCQKWEKNKFASISLTVRGRPISSKFWTHRVSKQCNLGKFQKIFLFPKMVAILNFRIFAKNGKTQITSISLTVRDRAISLKFSTPGYLRNVLLAIFKKFSSSHIWRPF